MLHVSLDLSIIQLAPNEMLRVEDSVMGVHGDLVLYGVTNETLGVGEGDTGGSGSVALVIRNDVHTIVLTVADARVGGIEGGGHRREAEAGMCMVVVQERGSSTSREVQLPLEVQLPTTDSQQKPTHK